MIYRRRASALHAARAAAALAWVAAVIAAALSQSNPVVLAVLAGTIWLAGLAAGVGRELAHSLRLAIPLALTICVINALVTRDGVTVIWRFGDLPVLGQTDVTLEATVYGAVLGLRAVCLVLVASLYSLAIDPDQVLRLFRRVSFRSALTAAVATRLVPVLVRDSQRLADAQSCRPGPAPGRVQLLRATTSGVLDRALDVAAALEVRGYSVVATSSGAGRSRPPWSRHDWAFSASAVSVLAIAVAARVANLAPFVAYPALHAPAGLRVVSVAALLVACALAPFAQRQGIEP